MLEQETIQSYIPLDLPAIKSWKQSPVNLSYILCKPMRSGNSFIVSYILPDNKENWLVLS